MYFPNLLFIYIHILFYSFKSSIHFKSTLVLVLYPLRGAHGSVVIVVMPVAHCLRKGEIMIEWMNSTNTFSFDFLRGYVTLFNKEVQMTPSLLIPMVKVIQIVKISVFFDRVLCKKQHSWWQSNYEKIEIPTERAVPDFMDFFPQKSLSLR